MRATRRLEVDWVVLAAHGRASGRGAGERRGVPGRRRRPLASRCIDFRDGFLPYVGGRGQGRLRGAKARVDPDLVFTHTALRLPPGPPLVVRADVEHVPRPSDPRVRDPQGRRRPRPSERVRPPRRTTSSARSWRCSSSTSRASGRSTGSTTAFPRAHAAARDGRSLANRFAEAFTAGSSRSRWAVESRSHEGAVSRH